MAEPHLGVAEPRGARVLALALADRRVVRRVREVRGGSEGIDEDARDAEVRERAFETTREGGGAGGGGMRRNRERE